MDDQDKPDVFDYVRTGQPLRLPLPDEYVTPARIVILLDARRRIPIIEERIRLAEKTAATASEKDLLCELYKEKYRLEEIVKTGAEDYERNWPWGVIGQSSKENKFTCRQIIGLSEPKTKDDWFHAIRDCILSFESEKRYTPNETELWAVLKTNPPDTYGIGVNGKGALTLAGDSPLDREAFGKRYKRLYPPNSDKGG